ncbi:MAG: GAF domain-containing sensor histidine kinase [Actinomycetota bacterium]|nr:GAF domain-containing sensor histidine kinase [Actinomycetota bacterium]
MMMVAAEVIPPDEQARLDAIRRYDILDTPPDGAFDRITALAARLCHVPIATITIVDEDRIWFKSAHGIQVEQIDRDPGLCASAIIGDLPYVVTDAIDDPRTLNNPLVRGELGLRFYVAIPLVTSDGFKLGTLNVIDVEPREARQDEIDALTDLAAVVMDELELRLVARRTIELEAAREAAAFRESVLAGISHQMRTSISILHGIVSLEPDDELDDTAMRTMMRQHIRQLDWLVNQYLDFTCLEAGRLPTVNPERVHPATLAGDAISVFTADADITLDLHDDLPNVLADPSRTRQILIELLNNAIRFGPHDGPVAVRVRLVDNHVAITVADQGPGIPRGDHDRIFDKLSRGRDSTGSGIGLYVARTLAHAQRSRIEVDSSPGEGSRFTLALPALTSESVPN